MINCCLTPSNNEPHAYYKFNDMHIHVHVVILAHLSDQKPFPNFYLVHLPVVTTGNNSFFFYLLKNFKCSHPKPLDHLMKQTLIYGWASKRLCIL